MKVLNPMLSDIFMHNFVFFLFRQLIEPDLEENAQKVMKPQLYC